ncbi:MAG TPA: hypothetical protein VGE07_08495 [Herpetosiphonaceae bacterium]
MTSFVKRALSRWWFAWGQSTTYWANRMVSPRLYEEAVGSFTRATEYDPAWPRPLLRRGTIRGRELADYAGAVRDLTRAIELATQSPEPYLQRGLLHAFHGLHAAERAIDDFERFLELAPAHSWRDEARQQIGRLQAELAERKLTESLGR